LVSSLTTVPTAWSYTNSGVTGTYNASWDVWFSTGSGGDGGSPSGGYLMVWLYKPSGAQPIGSLRSSSVSLTGGSWDVWIGTHYDGHPVISYVRTSSATTASFDLNVFIKDAVSRDGVSGLPTIKNSWYLTNIFAGFEIWSGGNNLHTTNFCAVVN
jgi:hypothetical protein